MNDGIPVEDPSVTYSRNDDAIVLIWRPGAGSSLGITDIKSAFVLSLSGLETTVYLVSIGGGNYCSAQCNTLIWV